MILEYNKGIQKQTRIGAFNAYTRFNHRKWRLQMATSSIPKTSGIYKITCTANSKIYVGSSVNLHQRQIAHFKELRNQRHANQYLQHAFNKYGQQSFIFEIIELVENSELKNREQYWLDFLRSYERAIGFNISIDATAPTRGRKMGSPSDETRAKIGRAHKGSKRTPEARERMSIAQTGKKHTPEQKEKIAAAHRGKPKNPDAIAKTTAFHKGRKRSPETVERIRVAKTGFKHSDESRAKMSKVQKGKIVSEETRARISASHMGLKPSQATKDKMALNRYDRLYLVTNLQKGYFTRNLNQFCKDHGLSQSRMSAVSLGLQDNHKGWKVRRLK